MKKFLPVIALLLCSTPAALAWNCPTGQIRQQAPPGTPTTAPFYDVVEGIAFICVPSTPPPPTTPPNQTQNQSQSQTQNSSANSNATSNSSTSSKSTSSAMGGNSTSIATGGSATATGGSSGVKNSGNSALSNSGNSSNTNNNSAQGGSGGYATSSNNSAGNVTSFSSIDNQVRQTPIAYAPDAAFTTSPCVKGFSGGVSTPGIAGSLGLSKTDKGCDSRQTAVIFFALGNKTAAAKMLCSTDASKRAKLSLEECLAIVAPPQPQVIVREPLVAQPAPPQVIVIQAPTPVPAVVKSSGTLQDLGGFRVTRSYSTNLCPTTSVVLGANGVQILNKAISLSTHGEVILVGNVYTTAVATSYLRKHGVNKVVIRAADEQDSFVGVQIWSAE